MKVLELASHGRASWDAYVLGSAQTTIYQLSGWKAVMQRTHGLETRFLLAQQDGQIGGVLPLLHVNSRIGGHYWTSMPGGLCAETDEAAAALLERACQHVKEARANYLFLRDGGRRWDSPELVTDESQCTLVVEIPRDPEKVWKAIKKRARQLTNQAMEAGVQAAVESDGFGECYPAYSQAMRDKGTPTLGIGFFRRVLAEFNSRFQFMAVRQGSLILGGGFISPFQDTLVCTWGGMLRRFYDLRPNHILYWATLKLASENGFRWVDLGRSRKDSGTFVFKSNWGAVPRPLYQQYYLHRIAQPPAVGSSREENASYRLFVRLWQRLPLPLTELLGPQLRKRIPFG